MKKLKGPDLKMPELKVPAFLTDLYHDLRDRRLLPLVAFVLVAIVAVPFLLSGGSDESAPPRVEPPSDSAAVNASQLTVVQATPGLRDYRKRFQGRSPKDPFKGPEAKPDLTGTQLGSAGDNGFESSEVTSSTSTTTTSSGTKTETTKTTEKDGVVTTETETKTDSDAPGSSGQEGETPGDGQITLYSFAIDVRIKKATTAPDGSTESDDPVTRSRVLSPAPLPGEKTQVVTYAGISPKTRNPLFLVSDEVTSVFGEAECLSGSRSCQLLEVEKGMPLTFVYGPAGDRYKVTVLKVFPVTAGKF
ncbi:MAG TPA: hypothetical protein VNR67_09070 [Solirubrobacterales bacterium]|nr:hypothetical protein [Solirubrobacterales bacterium]